MKNNKFNKKFSLATIFATLMFVLLFAYCISLLIPVFWMIWSSFKDVIDFYLNPFGLPDKWFPSNYKEAFNMLNIKSLKGGKWVTYDIWSMTGISLIYSVGKSILGTFWPMVVAYAISKYNFKGKHFLYAINLFVMTVPIVGTLPASLRLYKALGIYDNLFFNIILTGIPFGFAFILFYGAFKSISNSYAEAARIDGAGHFAIMILIMFPMMMPTYFAQVLLAFIGNWNDYMVIITWLPSYANLAFGMYMFQAEAARNGVGMPHILAGFVIVAIPTSIMWIASQKLITSKMMIGGLKE